MRKRINDRFRVLLLLSALVLGGLSHAQDVEHSAPEWNALGVEHYSAGDWVNALQCFLQAAALVPDNQTVFRNLSNAYQAYAGQLAEAGDYSTAAQQLEESIKVDSYNPMPRIQLGSYFLRMGLVQDAIARLEEAILLAPENLDAHELLGDAYYQDNDLSAALAQWEFVAEVNPGRAGLQEKLEKGYREDAVEYNFRGLRSRHFEIGHAPETDHGLIRQTLTVLEHAYRDIGRNFGNIFPPTPIQVKVYIADDFARATALGPHVAAIYDGTIRLPVSDDTGSLITPEELRRLLYHEYTHVVVRYLCREKAPWWLNEGLAETFSDELSPRDVAFLRQAYDNNELIPFDRIQESQVRMASEYDLRLAYRQAHAATRYLWRRYGTQGLVPMMDALAQGIPPEEALLQSYKLNYDRLLKDVVGSVVRNGY